MPRGGTGGGGRHESHSHQAKPQKRHSPRSPFPASTSTCHEIPASDHACEIFPRQASPNCFLRLATFFLFFFYFSLLFIGLKTSHHKFIKTNLFKDSAPGSERAGKLHTEKYNFFHRRGGETTKPLAPPNLQEPPPPPPVLNFAKKSLHKVRSPSAAHPSIPPSVHPSLHRPAGRAHMCRTFARP